MTPTPSEQFLAAAGVVVGLIVLFFVVCILCGFLVSSQVSREEEEAEAKRLAAGWGEAE
jgi:hypothetical protein